MTTDGGDRSLGVPRFDVVLRGYDRRQVDEHLSRLQRVLSRMRADFEVARSQTISPPPPPPGLRPRPTPRPRPDGMPGGEEPDVVGTFTDRMQTILQAAEDEAAEIRAKARAEADRLASSQLTVRAEEEKARAALANLVRQRDAVLADLTRVRGQLEALLSGPTARITLPSQDATTAAAARRDAGAGHPLPGTPTPPRAESGPREADKAGGGDPGSSAPTAESSGGGSATAAGSPAELTVVMAPDEASAGATSDDDPADDGAPVADAEAGADDTVRVGAVGRLPSRS